MKKIIILGGGTAGWLAALFCKKFVSDTEITVIESSQIGILGAGEGTVPHFVMTVLQLLEIPVGELFKRCDATVKLGIKFSNWNGDGKSYLHTFHQDEDIYEHLCNIRPSYVPIIFFPFANSTRLQAFRVFCLTSSSSASHMPSYRYLGSNCTSCLFVSSAVALSFFRKKEIP